jgi:hypothetical protein
MSSTLIVIRSHKIDPPLSNFAERLTAMPFDVCFALDERAGELDTRGFPKVSLNLAGFTDLGLQASNDFFWRCGDYALYLAREKFPDFSRYWMVEPDAFFNFHNLEEFFSRYEDKDDDLLGLWLRKTNEPWVWRKSMAELYTEVYGCFFPCVRFSASALDFLLKRRKTERFHHDGWYSFPNDEVFCATELINNGFQCHDLNAFGKLIATPLTCRNGLPVSIRWLQAREPDGLLYHPALTGEEYVTKLRACLGRDVKDKKPRDFMLNRYDDILLEQCGFEEDDGVLAGEIRNAITAVSDG